MDLLLPPGHDLPEWANPLEYGRSTVIERLPDTDYHGARALVSKSALDVFARSPAHYAYYLEAGLDDDEPTEALVIGAAFHCLALEPDVFERRYVRSPDFGDMRSSKNRALRDGWMAERPGMILLKNDQWQMIHGMRESLLQHKKIRRILENGRPEVTCAAIDPHTGLPRKCRFDWTSEIEGVGLDLKSAIDGRPDLWRLEAARRRYDVQDAYYTDTAKEADLDIDIMGFGVVEKTPPYVCGLYTLDPTARLAGEQRYMRELAGIAECCESGEFPGYAGGDVAELVFPGWAVADAESIT